MCPGLGVQGARGFGCAVPSLRSGCVFRVHISQTPSLFANSTLEDQGRGFESELLGVQVGGQVHCFWIEVD